MTAEGGRIQDAEKVQSDDADDTLALWKRRGKRAFDAESKVEDQLP